MKESFGEMTYGLLLLNFWDYVVYAWLILKYFLYPLVLQGMNIITHTSLQNFMFNIK